MKTTKRTRQGGLLNLALLKMALLLLTLLLVQSCGAPGTTEPGASDSGTEAPAGAGEAGEEETRSVFAVGASRAVQGQINDYIRVNGEVVTRSTVDVLPDIAGRVSRLNVTVGSRVVRDQVLAEIDPSRPGMNFVASPLRAPISGTVVAIPVNVGSSVAPSMPVIRLSQTEEIDIVTAISERFVSRLSRGQRAVLRFEAFPAERFEARVTEISPVLDPLSRSQEIKIALVTRDNRIRPGMFARIQLVTEARSSVVKIPAEGLVRRFGATYVFVVSADEEGRESVEMRPVRAGIRIDSMVEIEEGLAADELVVIRGQTLLEDNSLVRVVDEVPAIAVEHRLE